MAAADLCDAEHLEEVEGGAEPGGDVGDQEPGPPADGAAEPGEAVDGGLADEEGEHRREGAGPAGGEHLRAHAADAAELGGGEAAGGEEEVSGGAHVGEGGREEEGVGGGGGQQVDADGVEEEDLLLEGGVLRPGHLREQAGQRAAAVVVAIAVEVIAGPGGLRGLLRQREGPVLLEDAATAEGPSGRHSPGMARIRRRRRRRRRRRPRRRRRRWRGALAGVEAREELGAGGAADQVEDLLHGGD